jgi:hypothetical protein
MAVVNPSVRAYHPQFGAWKLEPEFPDKKSFGNIAETIPQLRACHETSLAAEKLKQLLFSQLLGYVS